MCNLPTGTLTLLFTDIERSTRLLHALGDRYPDVLAAYRHLVRAACAAHAGVEVAIRGDAFFHVFSHATEAIAAATAAQQALAAYPWPRAGTVRVRMGLHTGEPRRTPEGYIGIDVHRAARIGAAAHGGQVLVSETTAALGRHALPAGVPVRDLGEHRLKDFARSEHLFQLDLPDLPREFPPVRSLDTRPNNLPTPLTPLLGREREVHELVTLLRRSEVRLVVLTGPGGTGKTRLGLRVAADLLHDCTHGAFFVSLASVSDPALVATTVLRTLGVQEMGSRPAEELTAYLREREMLLLLDNFEQVLPAASVLADLVAACPRLTLLVTSRAAVRLSVAREYAVASLALPAPTERSAGALAANPAVALFVDRAVAVRADFVLTDDTAVAVAAICHRLDGLPLAIELAAARVKLFSPPALLGRLEQRLRMLTGGALDLPPRQQTLRGAIAWSYDLLSAAEQALFRRVAVFVGGGTLAAVEAVCSSEEDALEVVASLVDQSLLQIVEAPTGEPRVTMLETTREFALEQLTRTGERDAIRQRHAEYVMQIAEALEPRTRSATNLPARQRLDAEYGNITAALQWATETRATDLGLRLFAACWIWFVLGLVNEGMQWARTLLAMPAGGVPVVVHGRALHAAATLAYVQEDYAWMRRWSAQAITLLRTVDDRFWLGYALTVYALAHVDQDARAAAHAHEGVALVRATGDPWSVASNLNLGAQAVARVGDGATARAWWQESAAIFDTIDFAAGRAMVLNNLAGSLLADGDEDAGRQAIEEGLPALRAYGMTRNVAVGLCWLGWLALRQGERAGAAARFAESITVGRDTGFLAAIAMSCEGLASLALDAGDAATAAQLLGAADRLRSERAAHTYPWFAGWVATVRTGVHAALREDAFTTATAAGGTRPLEHIITAALAISAELGAMPAAPGKDAVGASSSPDGLTAREVEVLRLLATGKTNPEIAATLVLSVHTVERHVANLYGKIGAHTRVEAATYAQRHGLV